MCYDTVRSWLYCGHEQYIYSQYGRHVHNELNRINDPRYLAQPGIPYQQSQHCIGQTQREDIPGFCPACSTVHMTREGWNVRGYVPRRQRYY